MNNTAESVEPRIDPAWREALKAEFTADYFKDLKQFLKKEKKQYTVYPPGNRIFAAYDHTPFDQVKVVIIGQDPYHGPGQANGLCFSVSNGVQHPPSLANIFKELENDLGIPCPDSGNLEKWARQGVLLLNATLTVRKFAPRSHQGKGWERFTNASIKAISENKRGIVFLLWGRYAQEKKAIIDQTRHHILETPHPSPYSAHKGFFGCRHFSTANKLLRDQGKEPIDWNISE